MTRTTPGGPSGKRNVVRDAKAGRSHSTFYLALGALLLVGLAVVALAVRRSTVESAPILIERDVTVPAAAGGYVLGSPTATVEIIEFADFECPGCGEFAKQAEPEMRRQLIETGIARFRFLDFQVNDSHRNSPAASVAAACANDQGKFWEMHDRLFAGQAEWSTQATATPKPVFAGYARQIALDVAAWEECFDAKRHAERIAANLAQAGRVGLRYTPSLLIGRRMLEGVQPFEAIKAAVDSTIAEAKATPAPGAKSGDG